MGEDQVKVGTVPFSIPSVDHPCETSYTIIGSLQSGLPPLVCAHGGPGSGHEYLLPFAALWQRYQIPVVLYDQIGCGASTHLRHKVNDHSFWTVDLFIHELENLLDALHLRDAAGPGYHFFGHSWGGVFGAAFAARSPRGLRKLILANAPATFDLYRACCESRSKELSPDAQLAIEEAARTGDYQSENYRSAEQSLLRTFWCRADPFPPKELEARMRHQQDDRTVFVSLYGPTLFQCTGSISGWDCIEALPRITAPTLVYIGEFDVVQEVAIEPFVKNIPGVRTATVSKASHMSHLDNAETREEVLELVGNFLLGEGN